MQIIGCWMGRLGRALLGLSLGSLLSGCTGSGEDTRVTLCKDLTIGLLKLAEAPAWTEVRTEIRRSEHLAVRLAFDARDQASGRPRPMSAVCYYRHNAVDENAFTVADPSSAYSTSPYRMTLNESPIGGIRLAIAIKDAMLKQGGELLDHARRGVEDAAKAVEDALAGDRQR